MKKLILVLACVVSTMVLAGCDITIRIGYSSKDTNISALEAGSILKEMETSNRLDVLLEKYGRVMYRGAGVTKDGTSSEFTLYRDDARCVMEDADGLLVIENGEAYGRNTDGLIYRYLFVGNFDEFLKEHVIESPFAYDINEKIVSFHEENGIIYMETAIQSPDATVTSSLADYGYQAGDFDSLAEDYIVDASTGEMLEIRSYVVKDGVRTMYLEYSLTPACSEYSPDPEIVRSVFKPGDPRVVVVRPEGNDGDYAQVVENGCSVIIYMPDGYEKMLYTDPECTVPLEYVDREKDLLVYLKKIR